MNVGKRWILTTVLAGSIVGGGLGGSLIASTVGNAATAATTTTTAGNSAPAVTANGTFVPNENTAHEAGESAAREAQEDAGLVPTIP